MEQIAIIVPLLLLAVLMLAGLPIGFSLGLCGFIGYCMVSGFDAAFSRLGTVTYSQMANFLFSPIPLFILMGEILHQSGIGADVYSCAAKWFGRLRGGLCVASIIACAIFAAMCGLSLAGSLAIGVVAIPEMLKRGYDKRLACGSVAVAGTLGILIPPSLSFILYGAVGQVSIGALFIAGIIPGIVLTLLFSTYVILIAWRHPDIAPGLAGVTWKERIVSLKSLWGAVVIIFAVLGSIYLGIATPTEAAGVGAFGALIVALANRRLGPRTLVKAALTTITLNGLVFIIIIGSTILGYYLTLTGLTQGMSAWVGSLDVSRWVIILGINVLLLILGTFLDPSAIILLTTPILLPIVMSLGFDPIWFGVVMTINMEIAFITPPLGYNLYGIYRIAPEGVTLGDVLRGSVPFILLTALGIILISIFPQLALWLPSKMMG